jgi:hypothetical protein
MNQIFHPALRSLFLQNVGAKTSKAIRSLRSPRRIIVTVVALLLGCVWLSQIVISIFFRPPADPVMLRERIALGLIGFLLFQMLKIVYRKPVEPFEWTPSETQILKTAPISRSALVVYRLTTTAIAAALKALCFVLVMIPDLNYLLAGFIGMTLGLCFVELIRIITEVIVYGSGRRSLKYMRIAATGAVVGLAGWAILTVAGQPDAQQKLASPAAYQFLLAIALQIAEYTHTTIGAFIVAPLRCFSDIILTQNIDLPFLLRLLSGCVFVLSAAYTAMVANCWMVGASARMDRKNFTRLNSVSPVEKTAADHRRKTIRVPYRLNGIGAIAWRQFHGAWNYRCSILVSFTIPVALCCVPMFASTPPANAAMFLVASLLFYSYLLLPAALMLDFRRDVDRMAVLKKLPIEPVNIVIGQLAAPVVLCSIFQAIVFFIAFFAGVASYGFLAVCWLAIVPMNALIFASENIIFMLHPYRRNKEGADVLIRSVLTFTGKGAIWVLALTGLVAWALASSFLAKQMGLTGAALSFAAGGIFLAGTSTGVSLLAYLCVRCLARMFERFDPGADSVALN